MRLFLVCRNNENKFVFTEIIRLLAFNFYEAVVNLGFILVNNRIIEIFKDAEYPIQN